MATFKEAVKLSKEGEDILASSHREAREIAKAASEGKKRPTRDPAHRQNEGQQPHYHPNPRTGSHIFYSMATAVTVAGHIDCDDCIDSYLAEVVDFFNPLAIPKDVIDIVDEF
ncbi:MAG: hypothetical protein HY080_04565 [Gammaproteobacteria bacterium]|nr:hypothetical protein [Gammaproteobacteria bacterium]